MPQSEMKTETGWLVWVWLAKPWEAEGRCARGGTFTSPVKSVCGNGSALGEEVAQKDKEGMFWPAGQGPWHT